MNYQPFDPATLPESKAYFLMTAAILPRPIALITSVGETGVVNAAPFSFFNGICSEPMLVMTAVARKDEGLKDTARNILARKQYVINVCTAAMVEGVTTAAEPFPAEVSEVEEAGWTLLPGVKVNVPRIEQSPVQMECELYDHRVVGDEAVDLIIGKVVLIHVREDVMEGGRIRPELVDPLGRIDAGRYVTFGRVIDHRGLKKA